MMWVVFFVNPQTIIYGIQPGLNEVADINYAFRESAELEANEYLKNKIFSKTHQK